MAVNPRIAYALAAGLLTASCSAGSPARERLDITTVKPVETQVVDTAAAQDPARRRTDEEVRQSVAAFNAAKDVPTAAAATEAAIAGERQSECWSEFQFSFTHPWTITCGTR